MMKHLVGAALLGGVLSTTVITPGAADTLAAKIVVTPDPTTFGQPTNFALSFSISFSTPQPTDILVFDGYGLNVSFDAGDGVNGVSFQSFAAVNLTMTPSIPVEFVFGNLAYTAPIPGQYISTLNIGFFILNYSINGVAQDGTGRLASATAEYSVVAVPEPMSLAVLVAGLAGLGAVRRGRH